VRKVPSDLGGAVVEAGAAVDVEGISRLLFFTFCACTELHLFVFLMLKLKIGIKKRWLGMHLAGCTCDFDLNDAIECRESERMKSWRL